MISTVTSKNASLLFLALVSLFFVNNNFATAFCPASTNGSLQKIHRSINGMVAASSNDDDSSEQTGIASVDVVACFGRLADRAFVLPNDKVEATEASGYEFGVLEAGRPKWLCTYEERTGKTQGGGNEMTHQPNWYQILFNNDNDLQNRDALRDILFSNDIKFQMPLAAPSGTFSAKGPITNEVVVDALWKMLGGDDDDGPLSSKDVSSTLCKAAIENGSDTKDHLTYAVFEKALLLCATEK